MSGRIPLRGAAFLRLDREARLAIADKELFWKELLRLTEALEKIAYADTHVTAEELRETAIEALAVANGTTENQ